MRETNGKGVDIAFETSGAGSAFAQAIAVIRTFGRLGGVGRPVKDMIITSQTYEKILRAQITIKGTWSFEFN